MERARKIPLTLGKEAIVDEADYAWLSQWKWYAHKKDNTFYVHRKMCVNGKEISVQMHREILGLKYGDGKLTDHKNRNGLDNRKKNLRVANYQLNAYNCKMRTDNTSGYRGVSWNMRDQRWITQVRVNGTPKYFGSFTDIIKAAQTYDAIAFKYRGADAILNFPKVLLGRSKGMDKNRELHEALGLKWHEHDGSDTCHGTLHCKGNNPDYASDPRLVLREMKKLKLWLGFLGHLDDLGYYDKLTEIPELFMDETGYLRDMAIEYLRSK